VSTSLVQNPEQTYTAALELANDHQLDRAFRLCADGLSAAQGYARRGNPLPLLETQFPLLQAEIIRHDPRVKGVQEASEIHGVLLHGLNAEQLPDYPIRDIDARRLHLQRSQLLQSMGHASMVEAYLVSNRFDNNAGQELIARADYEFEQAWRAARMTGDQEAELAAITAALRGKSFCRDLTGKQGVYFWQKRLKSIQHRRFIDMDFGGPEGSLIWHANRYIQGPGYAHNAYRNDPYGFAAHQLINTAA